MIVIPVIIAAGLGFLGGVAVAHFWSEIVDWMKGLVSKLADLLVGLAYGVAYATGVFAGLIDAVTTAIKHKLYYQESGQWIEKTTTRKIKESELPPSIRSRIRRKGQEVDVTNEMEMELGCSI